MRKETKEKMDAHYNNPDPWNYRTTPDDQIRKEKILSYIPIKLCSILDLGCGEGFITEELKARRRVVGIDISEKALKRRKSNYKTYCLDIFKDDFDFLGVFDLVVATGVLYDATEKNIKKLIKSTSKYFLSCHIDEWNYGKKYLDKYMKILKEETFPYFHTKQYIEKLTLYHI
jgi:SAM-dependent methyltransferase